MATDSDRFGPLHDPAVRSQRLGTHEIFIEGDIVFQRAHGTTTHADTQEMFALCNEVYERYGYVLVLIESSQGGMATPEARKCVFRNPTVTFIVRVKMSAWTWLSGVASIVAWLHSLLNWKSALLPV